MTQWQRTEGSLLGAEVSERRDDLVTYFQEHNVPALLEFYPGIDNLVGLSVLTDADNRIATLGENALTSGLELEDLAADVAERFDLGVIIGDVSVEVFDDGVELEFEDESGDPSVDDAEDIPEEEIDLGLVNPVRAVTITAMTEDRFPILARALGEPITTAAAGYLTVILTSAGEQVPGTYGWDEQMLPVVQIIAAGSDRTVIAESDQVESTVRMWGSERVLTAKGRYSAAVASELAPINSEDDDARIIASVSPSATTAGVLAALNAKQGGPAKLLGELGIGREVADFLEGIVSTDELSNVLMYSPVTTSQILFNGVSDVLDEAKDSRLVEWVEDIDDRHPSVMWGCSIMNAAVGSALITSAVGGNGGGRKFKLVAGGLLLAKSAAHLGIYEWLRRRYQNLDFEIGDSF